ncbi:hypothetical protein H10PHJ05_77 [Aeromonas phage HJ05]|nr:hypothetical protein H10PHJ05_77 [Aeromonas phage HJ05]
MTQQSDRPLSMEEYLRGLDADAAAAAANYMGATARTDGLPADFVYEGGWDSFDELPFPEPSRSAVFLGELTPHEKGLVLAAANADDELAAISEYAAGSQLSVIADKVKSGEMRKAVLGSASGRDMADAIPESIIRRGGYLHRLSSHLWASLYFGLASRLDVHDKPLTLTTKGRVVAEPRSIPSFLRVMEQGE